MPLIISGITTVLITVIAFYLDKRTSIGKSRPFIKQTVYGFMFAAAAIIATEFGSTAVGGATINCRDAAIVVCGLLFGPWAGILSGI